MYGKCDTPHQQAQALLPWMRAESGCRHGALTAHGCSAAADRHALRAKWSVAQVIIAGAGGAAHLPGMVAALTPLPVVGVPVVPARAQLGGVDALLSIVQARRASGLPARAQKLVALQVAIAAQLIAQGSCNSCSVLRSRGPMCRQCLRGRVHMDRVCDSCVLAHVQLTPLGTHVCALPGMCRAPASASVKKCGVPSFCAASLLTLSLLGISYKDVYAHVLLRTFDES